MRRRSVALQSPPIPNPKSAAYRELVADVQKKYGVNDGENPRREINLSTYWQGFGILGYDLKARHDDLFFTNFSLRLLGNKESQPSKKTMIEDADFFRRLCKILEPENILCLGKDTFACVYQALTGESFGEIKNYNDVIENLARITARCGSVDARIYPLAESGLYGIAMRNGGLKQKNFTLDKEISDWERIAQDNSK